MNSLIQFIYLISIFLQQITPQIHLISFSFCPIIFGGLGIFAIIKLLRTPKTQLRENIWSILAILIASLVLVFVGLNTFYWQSDLLFYLFIGIRFSLLLFIAILANPYLPWSPFKELFITKDKQDSENKI
ncbi:MAG: hypothetical protein U9O98_06275 [Asgard group archaeon]|nr:hypothetical protein [Asgard group archaeon]